MENIWYKDINVLTNRVSSIIPLSSMTTIEKINAAMRFSILFSLIIYITSKGTKHRVFMIPIFTAIVSVIINTNETHDKPEKRLETYSNHPEDCVRPTQDNPFMNITMNEYIENPERKKACIIDATIKDEINDIYNSKIYRDINELVDTSDRQYYTMPNTQIPNDQIAFAKKLYGFTEKTCKEGNGLKCKYFSDNV